ncbi:MAG: phosphoesterase [Actinobacteria bacterium]|nr:phosphoesterase [Actinomycetota bacterium]
MAAENSSLASVQHIVHLMLENRSFDHMLGFLYPGKSGPGGQPFEGLLGTESNDDSTGKPVTVFPIEAASPNAYFMPGADPGEGYANTNVQLFGKGSPPKPPVATMTGFVTSFEAAIAYDQRSHQTVIAGTTASDIMGIFTPAALPVLSGLARGFAVCDHWYSSVPTDTLPNRAFACAATSQGHMSDATRSFTVQSIFGLMTAHNLGWKIYGYDAEPLTRSDFPDTLDAPDTNFAKFADFQADAATGRLPAYSFLEPSWSSTGNSQHPNYDVALGEAFILQVYRAVRNGPGWASTLLIVSYDEHGGCYDHVPPPTNATPPDSTAGESGFDFTRFGVRVPAVLVSPLIPAGTIYRVPAGSTPIDHTSVLKTIEQRWALPALTARDAAAPGLGGALTLTTPRADDPLAGVTAPVSSGQNPASGDVSHLLRLHAEQVSDLQIPLSELRDAPLLVNQHASADFEHYIAARTGAWKAARAQGDAPGSFMPESG